MGVLLECLVSPRITLENEFVSLLFSIDGLRHPMFRNLPMHTEDEDEDFYLTRLDFSLRRVVLFNGSYLLNPI